MVCRNEKVIKLINDGKSDDEIKKICIEKKPFGAAKEYRKKKNLVIPEIEDADANIFFKNKEV